MSERLRAALERAIVDAARAGAGVELEMRLAVSAEYFYHQFATCVRSNVARDVTYAGTRVDVAPLPASGSVRTERCETGRCLLACTLKRRIAAPLDFASNRGRLRVDVQLEMPAAPRAGTLERHKQRVSFRLAGADAWRVDFTRVDGAEQRFEVELELDATRCTPANAPSAAAEALVALRLLQIVVG